MSFLVLSRAQRVLIRRSPVQQSDNRTAVSLCDLSLLRSLSLVTRQSWENAAERSDVFNANAVILAGGLRFQLRCSWLSSAFRSRRYILWFVLTLYALLCPVCTFLRARYARFAGYWSWGGDRKDGGLSKVIAREEVVWENGIRAEVIDREELVDLWCEQNVAEYI